jgi:hypothetical protein
MLFCIFLPFFGECGWQYARPPASIGEHHCCSVSSFPFLGWVGGIMQDLQHQEGSVTAVQCLPSLSWGGWVGLCKTSGIKRLIVNGVQYLPSLFLGVWVALCKTSSIKRGAWLLFSVLLPFLRLGGGIIQELEHQEGSVTLPSLSWGRWVGLYKTSSIKKGA